MNGKIPLLKDAKSNYWMMLFWNCRLQAALKRRYSSGCGYGTWWLEPVCSHLELPIKTINNRCAICEWQNSIVERCQEQLLDSFLELLLSGSYQKKILKWLWLWDPMVDASWVPQILLVMHLWSYLYLHLPYRSSFCSSHILARGRAKYGGGLI